MQKLAGHVSPVTTARYDRRREAALAQDGESTAYALRAIMIDK